MERVAQRTTSSQKWLWAGMHACMMYHDHGQQTHINSLYLVLIDIFPYDTMIKGTKCAYQSHKYNIDFLLVFQCFN